MTGTTGVWKMPTNQPEPPKGEIGDRAGYVVLIQDRFDDEIWNETPSGIFDAIGHTVGMIEQYEDQQRHAARKDTYAVARLELVMISRPGDA